MKEILVCWYFSFLIFSNFEISSSLLSTSIPKNSNYYTAAVYEHNYKGNATIESPTAIINKNLDNFERAARVAKSKGADIFITPEYGIISYHPRKKMKTYLEEIPDPRKVKSNPCDQKEFANYTILYRLSCMAKRYKMVIVANTGDIQPCNKDKNPNCPSDNVFIYNTNVVFDRDGTLLAKHYKEYLFFEIGLDLPQEPQNSIFTTDFGTFSMYICFESAFKHMVDDVEKRGVGNIILSTAWFSIMPFWNSVQWFQSWALGINVTYLVSNCNNREYGLVGSGIFNGNKGALVYTFNPDDQSKLLISKIPKFKNENSLPQNLDSSITLINENGSKPYNKNEDGKDVPDNCDVDIVGAFHSNDKLKCFHTKNIVNYTLVKLTKPQDNLKVCNNGMCCSVEYVSENLKESYYLGVYNGTNNLFDRYFYCEENCIMTRCDSFNGSLCVHFPLKARTVFNNIKLKANFTTKYVYPSVLKSTVRLASLEEWTHNTIRYGKEWISSLNYKSSAKKGMLMAGMTGRCYDRDPPYIR